MNVYERTARDLLEMHRAKFVRYSSNEHEVWRLPHGRQFICNRAGRGENRAWRNNLATLRRLLRNVKPAQEAAGDEGPTACPGCKAESVLGELGLCPECTEHGMPGGVAPPDPAPEPVPEPVAIEAKLKGDERMKVKRRWIKAEIAQLNKLCDAGWESEKIAETMGRTLSSVKNKRAMQKRQRVARGSATIAGSMPVTQEAPIRCAVRLEYPSGQVLTGSISKANADELALRLLAGEL